MKKLLSAILGAAMLAAAAFGIASCGKSDDLEVVAPDGAPALALLNAIAQEDAKEDDVFDFKVVDSDTIATYVTGKSPEADICILPSNAAAKLLGTGTTYQMLGTVTHGNLFFLTTEENDVLHAENLSTLVGKKVGVVQLPNVPGLTLRAVLDNYDIQYNVLQSAQAEADPDKVNLVAFDAENVSPAGGCAYYLCPEPAASTKIKGTASTQKPFKRGGDLQELYGEGGYPQAVAVAKKSVIQNNAEEIAKFIGYLEGSAQYLSTVEPATVLDLLGDVRTDGLKPSFNANNLTPQVIANCSVQYTSSADCKAAVNAFLQKLINVSSEATALPADDFFYMG